MLVRTNVTRMARQLTDPTSKPPWKSHPEVTQTVEKVVAKLGATRRYGERFGPHRQQEGAVEPKKTDLATVETAHATPEQPATVQQRQQPGHDKPEKHFLLRLSLRSDATATEGVPASA